MRFHGLFSVAGGITEGEEFGHSFSEDATSLNRRNRNMEFKDATSAAQAAAESAEMASMAARAAAELARHGKVTREYPAESHASSFHCPRNEGPGRSTDWKFTDAHDEEDSSRTENGSPGSFHGAKPRIQNKERGETGQDLLSRAAASRYNDFGKANKSSSRHVSSHTKATSIDDNIASANHQKMDGFSPKSLAGVKAINQNLQGKDYENDSVGEGSFKIQSGRHTSTNSGMGSLHGEVFVVGQKTDSFSQKGFSEVKSLNQNWQNTKIEVDDHPGVGSFQEQSSNSTLSNSYMSPISSDDIWDRNAQSYDDVNQFSINTAGQGNTKRGTEKPGLSDSSEVVFDESGWDVNQFSINTGGGNTERGTEKPELNDFSGVVFDESGSDSDTHLDLKNDSTRHHFDSYFPTQGAPSSSHLTSGIDPLSTKQWRGESHLMDGSRIFVESTETIADATVPKQSDALLAATFDGSDGMNSETEEEGDSLKLREGMKSSSSSGKRNVSTIGLSSSRPTVSYFDKKEEDKEVNRNAWSHTSSDDSDLDEVPSKSNQEATLNVVGGYWKRYDQGDLLTNQLSPRRTRTARKSSDLSQEAAFTSMVENQQLLQPLTLPSDKEVAKKDKFGAQSSPPSSEESELSYNLSSKDGNELNLGRLTGGFRNKGFSRRSYVRGHLANTSASSTEQMADGTPTITDKPTILSSDKTSVSSNTKTLFDSDSDEAEVQPLRTGRSGGYRGVMLSRRTKDSPRQSVTSSPLKFNGRSEALVTSDFGVESGLSRPSSSVGEPVAKLANKNVFSESADNVKLTLPKSSIEQPYKLDAAMIEKSTISSSDKKSMHSEACENRLNNRKPHVNAPEELISTPKSDSDSDNDDSEVILSRQTAGSRGHRNATLSRRRGDSPSQLEMDSPQKFSGRSDVPVSSDFGAGSRFSTSSSSVSETLSKPPTETVISGSRQNLKPVQPASSIRRPSKFLPPAEISVRKETMQSSQPSSFSKQPLKPSSRIGMSGRDESQKSSGSSGGSASRENSLKTASHVHPKLPDYDILAARLESLRSDRRS